MALFLEIKIIEHNKFFSVHTDSKWKANMSLSQILCKVVSRKLINTIVISFIENEFVILNDVVVM